jgi:ABC-type glycerol-3-phosphate transport system substrate-binding protein
MRTRLEAMKNIPTLTKFNKDMLPQETWDAQILSWSSEFRTPTRRLLFWPYNGMWEGWIYFVQDHFRMNYSTPMLYASENGDIGFTTRSSFSIPNQSKNKDLAWEFIKFSMEYTEAIWAVVAVGNVSFDELPVNREQFNNQLYAMLHESLTFPFMDWSRPNDIVFTGTNAEIRAQFEGLLEYTIDMLREEMEMLNYEARFDTGAFMSLIYPDLYLYFHDFQDIDQTLRNIQDRLELYILE